jgi:hypothetical protein
MITSRFRPGRDTWVRNFLDEYPHGIFSGYRAGENKVGRIRVDETPSVEVKKPILFLVF